jgi:hypothetical protein
VGEKFSKDNEILKKKIRQMLEIKTQPIKYREWIQLWYIVRSFVNATMYPQYNNNMIKKRQNKKKIIIILKKSNAMHSGNSVTQ